MERTGWLPPLFPGSFLGYCHRPQQLRAELRRKRLEHAESLPREVSALVFSRPPGPVLELVPEGATIGLYRSDVGRRDDQVLERDATGRQEQRQDGGSAQGGDG